MKKYAINENKNSLEKLTKQVAGSFTPCSSLKTRVEIFNFLRSNNTTVSVLGFIKIPKTPRDGERNINKALRPEIAFRKE
jgi:hypothetical protein